MGRWEEMYCLGDPITVGGGWEELYIQYAQGTLQLLGRMGRAVLSKGPYITVGEDGKS